MFAWTLWKIKHVNDSFHFKRGGKYIAESTNRNKGLKGPLSKQNKQRKKKCPNRGNNIDKSRVADPYKKKQKKRKEKRVKQRHNLSSNPRRWRNRQRCRHQAQTLPPASCADCAISRARDQVALEGGESPPPDRPPDSPSDRALFLGGSL
jgi:hypothetical protein